MKRREFLISAMYGAGVLSVGVLASTDHSAVGDKGAPLWLGHFLRFDPSGVVTVVSPHMEMGQGAETGIALLVAEELDADWSRVRVESAPADKSRYRHALMPLQITGGSSSLSSSWRRMRMVGASARAMFIEAAAAHWSVPANEIQVRDSKVTHLKSERQLDFSDLLASVGKLAPSMEPTLKNASEYRLLGRADIRRLDAVDKVTGRQEYTIDGAGDGTLTALVAHPPKFGAKLASFDASKARTVAGVVDIFAISTGVAVVATGFYPAFKARQLLEIKWNDDRAERRSSTEIQQAHRRLALGLDSADWSVFGDRGQFKDADDDLILDVSMPYVAHAAMEPMNCVAAVDGNRVKMQYGCQSHSVDQANVAKLLGIEASNVEIETLQAGGSFGRRSVVRSDYQIECVEIASRIGKGVPIKLQWTREDDMSGADYRGVVHHYARIQCQADGIPVAWKHRVVSTSLVVGTAFGPADMDNYVENHIVEGVAGSPYLAIPEVLDARVAYTELPITVGWMRAVGNTHTAFVMEHAIDCIARRVAKDPVVLRRELYESSDAHSHLRVLDRAAALWGWAERELPKGHAAGIAVHQCFGSTVATVAEVSGKDATLKVHRVLVVVDCGFAVNPSQVIAQAEGGVNYALSWSLFGEINIDDGEVQNRNFHNYRVLRMSDAPEISVDILPSDAAPTGVGEPVSPVVVPAVGNALLALHGEPITSLPFVKA